MGLLAKLVREGYWDFSRRPEIEIDVDSVPDEQIEELLETGSTVVFAKKTGKRIGIRIPNGVDVEQLKNEDFEITELPDIAAISDHKSDP